MSTVEAIAAEITKLSPEQQQRVLEYARSLSSKLPPGARLEDVLKHVGKISPEDLRLMEQAIEEGCEQVDIDGW